MAKSYTDQVMLVIFVYGLQLVGKAQTVACGLLKRYSNSSEKCKIGYNKFYIAVHISLYQT